MRASFRRAGSRDRSSWRGRAGGLLRPAAPLLAVVATVALIAGTGHLPPTADATDANQVASTQSSGVGSALQSTDTSTNDDDTFTYDPLLDDPEYRTGGDADAELGDQPDLFVPVDADDAPARIASMVRAAADRTANPTVDEPESGGELTPKKDPSVECGLNIALVLDMSTSIGPAEMKQLKLGAREAITVIAGSPTTLSIITFASETPAYGRQNWEALNLRMDRPGDVKRAINTILSLRSMANENRGSEGGTNWKAALERAADIEGLNTALFITDGWPTEPYPNAGSGSTVSNINGAYAAADSVRANGAEIYSLGVGLGRNTKTSGSYSSSKPPYLVQKYTEVNGKQKVDNGVVYFDQTPPDFGDIPGVHPAYFYDNSGKQTCNPDDVSSLNLRSLDPGENGDYSSYSFENNGRCRQITVPDDRSAGTKKVNVYRANAIFPKEALERVSNKFETIDNWDRIGLKLREQLSGCSGSVVINKSIHNGSADATVKGFEFKADRALVKETEDGGRNFSEVTRSTDSDGVVSFKIVPVEARDQTSPGEVRIEELDKAGYKLRLQDFQNKKANVTCKATRPNPDANNYRRRLVKEVQFFEDGEQTGRSDSVWLSNSGAKGFILRNVKTNDQVTCGVVNEEVSADFIVEKTSFPPDTSKIIESNDKTPQVVYKVKVTNNGNAAGIPSKLVEKPEGLTGLTVDSVSISNNTEGAPNNASKLLVSDELKPFEEVTDGGVYEFRSPSDTPTMNEISPGDSATAYVTVTYKRGEKGDLKTLRDGDNKECEEISDGMYTSGKGLVNTIEVSNPGENDPSNDSHACTSITFPDDPQFEIVKTKKNGGGQKVVLERGKTIYEVPYVLTVTNTGSVKGTPYQIIEKPAGLEGFEATKVVFKNDPDAAGGLLKDGQTISCEANKVAECVLPQEKMNEIESGNSNNHKSVLATVTYTLKDASLAGIKKMPKGNNEALGCSANANIPGEGKGLVNKVELKAVDGDSQAIPAANCTSVEKEARPNFVVSKSSLEENESVTVSPDSDKLTDVRYKITVTNNGTGVGSPFELADVPATLKGLEVEKVVFENEDDNGLLQGVVDPFGKAGPYVIQRDKLQQLEPDQSKSVIVTVTYAGTNDGDLRETLVSDKLRCQRADSGAGYKDNFGLVNSATVKNDAENSDPSGPAEACTNVEKGDDPQFQITKESSGLDPEKVPLTGNQTVEARYKVTVKVLNGVGGTPAQIIETPGFREEWTINSVKAVNQISGVDGAGTLLKSDEAVAFTAASNGGSGEKKYLLSGAKLNKIRVNEQGKGSDFFYVVVNYTTSGAEKIAELKESGTGECLDPSTPSDGKVHGLTNSVNVVNVPGGSESDEPGEACTDLTFPNEPAFSIKKTRIGGNSLTVDTNLDKTYTLEYNLKVENTSDVSGKPFKIVEKPVKIDGLEIQKLVFTASDQNNLLVGEDVAFEGERDEYVLDAGKLATVDPGADNARNVKVQVTYRGRSAKQLNDFLTGQDAKRNCDDSGGLNNNVQIFNNNKSVDPSGDSSVCTSVDPQTPDFSVAKELADPNAVVEISTTVSEISVTYKLSVTNDGKVAGVPFKLSESPKKVVLEDPGQEREVLTFIRAEFSRDKNGDSLLKADKVSFDSEQDVYELNQNQMVEIAPGDTKVVRFTVVYQGASEDVLRELAKNEEKRTCDSGETYNSGDETANNGLWNVANVKNIDADDPQIGAAEKCTNITVPDEKKLRLEKRPADEPTPILSKGKKIDVSYTIIAENPASNIKAITPGTLNEQPKPAEGISVKSVVAYNPDDQNAVRLLAADGTDGVAFTQSGEGWTLASNKFRAIEPGQTAEMKVTVTYEVPADLSDEKISDLKKNLECEFDGSSGENAGLYNEASFADPNSESENNKSCVPAKFGEISVSKVFGEGEVVTSRNEPYKVEPADEDVKIAYKVVNEGTASVSQIVLVDEVLDGDDQVTDTVFNGKFDECRRDAGSGGTITYADGVATFDPPLAPNEAAQCAFTFEVASIPDDQIHDRIHGDQLSGTPRYVDPDSDGSERDGATETGNGWMKFGSGITVTKRGLGTKEVAISEADKGSVDVAYLVSITNNGKRAATLPDLVDTPKPARGITVTNVKAESAGSNRTDDDVIELINEAVDPLEHVEGTDYWTLNKGKYASATLAPDATAEVLLTVTYNMSNVGIDAPADDLACNENGSNQDRGAANKVSMLVDGEEKTGEGCVSVTPAKGTATKLIKNTIGTDKDNAVPVLDDKPIGITYVYDNTGKATVPSVTVVDKYMDVATGDVTDEAVPGDMTCQVLQGKDVVTETTVTVNGDVVSIDPGLAPGQKLSCTRELTVEQMKFTDQYHANMVSITPSVPDGKGGTKDGPKEETPAWAVKIPPLTGNLPDTGGNGLRAPVLFSLGLLLAGVAMVVRRKRA